MTNINGNHRGKRPIAANNSPSGNASVCKYAWADRTTAHNHPISNMTPAMNLPTLPPPIARALNLRDVATQIGLAYATLRADWKCRVLDGRLPPPLNATTIKPLRVTGHPRWHANQLSAWLQHDRHAFIATSPANDTRDPSTRAARLAKSQHKDLDARLFDGALFG
jgi:hypothetical protein